MMAGVKFNHVTKRFGNVVAVNDLTLEVQDREFLVVVGPSGSGKSVTLRMLAGLEEVSEGEIWIGDRAVNNVTPKDRDVAMVFQSYALYPHMTVYDNLAFGLRLRKVPKRLIEQRVHAAARSLDIDNLLERRPRELSGAAQGDFAGRAIVRVKRYSPAPNAPATQLVKLAAHRRPVRKVMWQGLPLTARA
jgi:multiple sugar transport system ATP-binding protein